MGLGFSRQGEEDEPDEPVVVNDHNIQIDEDIDSLEEFKKQEREEEEESIQDISFEDVDNINTEEEPSPVSYRTLVYMVVWACMMFWMLTLGFVMITDNTATIGVDLNTSNRRSHTLENLNKFIGLIGSFIIAPLPMLFPPLFRRLRMRFYVRMIFGAVVILFYLFTFLTVVSWILLVQGENMRRLATTIILELCGSACVIIGYCSILRDEWFRHQNSRYRFENTDGGFEFELLVFIGTVIIFSLESGLVGTKHRHEADLDLGKVSTHFQNILPYYLQCWLFLIFLQHYSRFHVGWFTYRRCRLEVERELNLAMLSPIQQNILRKQPLTKRIIEGMLSVPLFRRRL
ncbi:uncharacterized protein LOC111701836 isoform X2 [Eurytemora carolleeae]|uniref:uncharacterized protein LOC111701836 isoform X2 n=1 Tax=Eurytemora carolleeae TaxID=1294199 RepID=UPI000C788BA9|nr:uncharacterized protein LOC111701836 isoform X2 [Eurytemora carolleeae]|eukprot:XP_023329050.1 uncharacterized protein LOC111701836 isoform X2 [Eurytemora affinis]